MSVYKVTLAGTFLGRDVDNVLGIVAEEDLSHSLLDVIAGQVATNWFGAVMSQLHNEYKLTEVTVQDLIDPTLAGSATSSAEGELSGALLPTFACAKVDWHTAKRGRAYRGRTGLCGLLEDDTDSLTPNNLKAARQTALQNAIDSFLVDMEDSFSALDPAPSMAVVSQVLAGAPRVPPIGTPIVSATVASELGTRRGRM